MERSLRADGLSVRYLEHGEGTPVLLLHGERDRLVPVRLAREAARRNPQWRLETLPDIGHVPQLEAPDDVADRIIDWLTSVAETSHQKD